MKGRGKNKGEEPRDKKREEKNNRKIRLPTFFDDFRSLKVKISSSLIILDRSRMVEA